MRNVILKRAITVSLSCFLIISICTHNTLLQVFAAEAGDENSGLLPYSDIVDQNDNLTNPVDLDDNPASTDTGPVDLEVNPVNPDVHLADPNSNPAVPNTDLDEAIKHANIVFSFVDGTQYVNPAQYTEDQKDAILLNGVSAVDENGIALTGCGIQEYGNFNIDNPGSGKAFTITYAATHPVTQKVFTATRDVYVTMGVMATAALTSWESLSELITASTDLQNAVGTRVGDVITIKQNITSDGTAIPIDKSLTLQAQSGTVTLTANTGTNIRHFTVSGGDVTLTFKNVVLKKASGTNYSGGISSAAENLTLIDATIQGCRAVDGGGVYATGNLTIEGGKISGNIAGTNVIGYGGGVYAAGTLEMASGEISGNTASNGGGIYSTNDSADAIFLTGGTISGNKASGTDTVSIARGCGGGIYHSSGIGTITIDGTAKISSNTVATGGGPYNGGNGGGIYTKGKIIIKGGIIGGAGEGNTALQNGGGIYCDTFEDDALLMTGGTISYNLASCKKSGSTGARGGGGGIFFSGGTATIDGTARITDNIAAKVPGATSNSNYGGGIYSTFGNVDIAGGVISNNSANYGGGIVAQETITIRGGTITGNTADFWGGGVSCHGDANSTLTLLGGTITGNTANGGGDNGGGGGIFANQLIMSGDPVVSGNTAPNGKGGGIRGNWLTIMRINGGTVSNNTAFEGGGIYSTSGIIMNDGTIRDNTAVTGGGICALEGSVYINDGKIINNHAESAGGGVAWQKLNNGDFSNVRIGSLSAPIDVFSGNTATKAYWLDEAADPDQYPVLKPLHDQKMFVTKFSAPPDGNEDFDFAYNNYDVIFIGNKDSKPRAASEYTVTYAANGGTGTSPTQADLKAGSTFPAAANTFTAPVGKQFKEWNTEADGNGTSYTAGATITMPAENLTLYAIWQLKSDLTVQFESNGGTPVSPLTNVTYGSTITRPPNPTREKYEFLYWYKDPALTQRWNFNTDTVTDNITLYARWEWTGEIIPGQS